MLLVFPTLYLNSVVDITKDLLLKMGIKALFVDIDNTLAKQDSNEPMDGAVEWVKNIVDDGLEIVMVSNNFKRRVSSFASLFNAPSVSFAKKPLPTAFWQAKRRLKNKNIKFEECLVVGDQVFTDVVGGNICGAKTALLSPIAERNSKFFIPQKKFEKHVRKKIENIVGKDGFVNSKSK